MQISHNKDLNKSNHQLKMYFTSGGKLKQEATTCIYQNEN